MEDYSNQNGHSGYDPKYNPQSYGPNYDYGSYGNDPYGEGGPNKSVKGLKIMIVIMALILGGLVGDLLPASQADEGRFRDRARYADPPAYFADERLRYAQDDERYAGRPLRGRQASGRLAARQAAEGAAAELFQDSQLRETDELHAYRDGRIHPSDRLARPDQQEARQRKYDDPQNDHHLQAAGPRRPRKSRRNSRRRCVRAP